MDVEIAICTDPLGGKGNPGQTRCEGVYTGTYDGQPNRTSGILVSTLPGDIAASPQYAASIVIDELGHYTPAYSSDAKYLEARYGGNYEPEAVTIQRIPYSTEVQ